MNENWLDIYDRLDIRGLWLPAPWQARLVVGGADARPFLQNFCTNDVLRAPVGSIIEGFFLNTKGHILHHGFLAVDEQQVTIYLVGSNASDLLEHLARYVIRERVAFALLETPWWLAIGGSWVTPAGEERADAGHLADSRILPFPALNLPAWIIESELTQEQLEFELGRAGYVLPAVEGVAEMVFDALRIESGLPLPGIDYAAATLPQELDRNRRAIHFEKGCYLGQETVARLDALGHVNKLLRGIRFANLSSPSAGTSLSLGEKAVGQVISLTYSPLLGAILGLAIVRREAAQEGTELTWNDGTAAVVTLPVSAATKR